MSFFLIALCVMLFRQLASPLILGFGNIQAAWLGIQSNRDCVLHLRGLDLQIWDEKLCGPMEPRANGRLGSTQ